MCCIVLTLHLMHTNLIKLFIVSLLFFSCSPKNSEDDNVPETLLTEEQLINTLTAAYLAEGASGINDLTKRLNEFQ